MYQTLFWGMAMYKTDLSYHHLWCLHFRRQATNFLKNECTVCQEKKKCIEVECYSR